MKLLQTKLTRATAPKSRGAKRGVAADYFCKLRGVNEEGKLPISKFPYYLRGVLGLSMEDLSDDDMRAMMKGLNEEVCGGGAAARHPLFSGNIVAPPRPDGASVTASVAAPPRLDGLSVAATPSASAAPRRPSRHRRGPTERPPRRPSPSRRPSLPRHDSMDCPSRRRPRPVRDARHGATAARSVHRGATTV